MKICLFLLLGALALVEARAAEVRSWSIYLSREGYARGVGEGRAPRLAVQRAGEVVHVPQGWAHAVLNLKESIGVAEEYACG